MNEKLKFHPLADIFPLIEGAEFDDLVADIKAHGQREPIVIYEDKILDGRNRYRACNAAGIEPTFIVYQGENPVAYVISLNLRRRHLGESQRAMVAAKLATLGHGGDRSKSPIGDLTQAGAAELLNVGKRSVERAREVQEHGAPELRHAVERGDVSVSAAADVATLPEDEQREIVARGERQILEAAKTIRGRRAEQRRTERIERLLVTTRQSAPLPSDRGYSVIYADPPWHFEVYNEESGIERAGGDLRASSAGTGRRGCRPVSMDDAAASRRSLSSHRGVGLSVQNQSRLGEGQNRAWLLRQESTRTVARGDTRRHSLSIACRPPAFGNYSTASRAQSQAR
jgi:ParB/Sulfiredoxin domain